MSQSSTDINVQQHNFDQIMLVDELSSIEYYIGVSHNFINESALNWRIKKIWKDGGVWRFEFPDGNQSLKYAWTERLNYDYKA
jgi:hypothetical protein